MPNGIGLQAAIFLKCIHNDRVVAQAVGPKGINVCETEVPIKLMIIINGLMAARVVAGSEGRSLREPSFGVFAYLDT